MENNEEAASKFLYNTHGTYSSLKGETNSGTEGMQQDNGNNKGNIHYSASGLGDVNLLNIISMSSDINKSASGPYCPLQYSAQATPTSLPLPMYSISGQNGGHGQVKGSVMGHSLSHPPCSGVPVCAPQTAIDNFYNPHLPPLSDISDTSFQKTNLEDLRTFLKNNQKASLHMNSGMPGSPKPFTRPQSLCVDAVSLQSKIKVSTGLQFSHFSNQPSVYDLSKIPGQEPSRPSALPLHVQDMNANCSPMGKQLKPVNPEAPAGSAHQSTCKASAPTSVPGYVALSGNTHSTSSTPTSPPSGASINGLNSPQVSELSSGETSSLVMQQSLAQSYASLTPWTSKLTAPGYVPLPAPAQDAMPIPLENIDNTSMLSLSPTLLEAQNKSWQSRLQPVYSRLQPGLATGYSTVCAKVKNNGVMRGSSQVQKVNTKMLPNKEHRFKRTADALQKSGLWEVAMKTGNLIKRNQELQRELEQFRSDALTFLKSVIKNPQNRDFIKNVLNNALTSSSGPKNSPSLMTVVVSATAAAAAASAKLDSCGSSDGSFSSNSSIYNGSNVSEASSEMNYFGRDNVEELRMDLE